MRSVVHEEKQRGYRIAICHDADPVSPRDDSTLGKMTCWHRRYDLGDKHGFDGPTEYLAELVGWSGEKAERYLGQCNSAHELIEGVQSAANVHAVVLPLYLFDHSGLTMNTVGFHCPWDSGLVGFIHVTLEQIRHEYGVKRVSASRRENIKKLLRNEVEVYAHYLEGAVYGFVVSSDDEELNSCWGFYGDFEEHCLPEARSIVSGLVSAAPQ